MRTTTGSAAVASPVASIDSASIPAMVSDLIVVPPAALYAARSSKPGARRRQASSQPTGPAHAKRRVRQCRERLLHVPYARPACERQLAALEQAARVVHQQPP